MPGKSLKPVICLPEMQITSSILRGEKIDEINGNLPSIIFTIQNFLGKPVGFHRSLLLPAKLYTNCYQALANFQITGVRIAKPPRFAPHSPTENASPSRCHLDESLLGPSITKDGPVSDR